MKSSTPHRMSNLQKDIDDLDRMVDTDAAKDAIRSQIRLIAREIAALEADYSRLAEQLAVLQPSQSPPHQLTHVRGLFYAAGDPVPFCPRCWEAYSRRVHFPGRFRCSTPRLSDGSATLATQPTPQSQMKTFCSDSKGPNQLLELTITPAHVLERLSDS